MEDTPPFPEFSVRAMIDMVSADKFTTYLELLQKRPVDSLEKRQREFAGIPPELIHYADAENYVMKIAAGTHFHG